MKLKKYQCKKDNSSYVIEEDLVDWYLIVNNDKSSKDYLFDALEDALFEAEGRFGIPKNKWKEIVV